MKVLFLGGSGNISSACTEYALKEGHELFHFNRGRQSHYSFGKNVRTLTGDYNNDSSHRIIAENGPYDVVANFICFTPDQMVRDIELFRNLTGQYIFISSATVYKKPPDHYLVTEECPLENEFWPYAQDKIACEKLLTGQSDLRYTIVRPSYTFGKTWIPTALTARDYNPVYRIKAGLPLISHGDGESLWITTHHTDFAAAFVKLFGNDQALNNHFHITSDEVHTWDQIYRIIGEVAGKEPNLIHIPSDFIYEHEPEWGVGLLGDKARSTVFDNSKIKSVVPGWKACKSFREGISESLRWFEADTNRMIPDRKIEERTENLINKYLKKQLLT